MVARNSLFWAGDLQRPWSYAWFYVVSISRRCLSGVLESSGLMKPLHFAAGQLGEGSLLDSA